MEDEEILLTEIDINSESLSNSESDMALESPETNLEEVAAADDATQTESPGVDLRISYDFTDQIVRTGQAGADANVDIRTTIFDPDLMVNVANIFGTTRLELGPAVTISSSPESSIDEEEETQSEFISYLAEFGIHAEKEPIDRGSYEEEYHSLKAVALGLRRKNGLLNRKLTDYYRKRQITRVFDPVTDYDSLLEKYEDKIEVFFDCHVKSKREKHALDNEIKDMVHLRDEQQAQLVINFSGMQDREKEIGRGLIDSNTGKVIPEKLVERLLARQESKSGEISKIRLAYIKLRDKVKEIDIKIKALETIGGTLHLMDFEQLRMENQIYSDKIEERDDELMRLRDRYSHTIQALAHLREKTNTIDVYIEGLQAQKYKEGAFVEIAREHLNLLQIKRDQFRAERNKLKMNTGILTYPKLLQDMEMGMKLLENYRLEEQGLQAINKRNREKLCNIRHARERIEQTQSKYQKKTVKTRK